MKIDDCRELEPAGEMFVAQGDSVGKFDSSLTRVQPIINALYSDDPTGHRWLKPFLQLASSTGQGTIPDDLGLLERAPSFEFPVDPPRRFLKWLIQNPQRLSNPKETYWKQWNARTQEKRKALRQGDGSIQLEAITEIEAGCRLPARVWWRLEGVTRVDCAIFTPTSLIFLEGKRTEIGPSKNVLFFPHRNQVLRNLDCAAAHAAQVGRKNFFVLLVVEGNLVDQDKARQDEIEATISGETIDLSLPHLTAEERRELLRHYLGVITWESIVDKFKLQAGLLVD